MWRPLHKMLSDLLRHSHSAPTEVVSGKTDGSTRTGDGLMAKRARPPRAMLLLGLLLKITPATTTHLTLWYNKAFLWHLLTMPLEKDVQMS